MIINTPLGKQRGEVVLVHGPGESWTGIARDLASGEQVPKAGRLPSSKVTGERSAGADMAGADSAGADSAGADSAGADSAGADVVRSADQPTSPGVAR